MTNTIMLAAMWVTLGVLAYDAFAPWFGLPQIVEFRHAVCYGGWKQMC